MDSIVTSHGIFSELLFRMALEASHNNATAGAFSSLQPSSLLSAAFGLSPAATILTKLLASVPFCESSARILHQPNIPAVSTSFAPSITSPTAAAVSLCLATVGANAALKRPLLSELAHPQIIPNEKIKEDKRSNLEKLINQLKKAKNPEATRYSADPSVIVIDGVDSANDQFGLLRATKYTTSTTHSKSLTDLLGTSETPTPITNKGLLSTYFNPQKHGERVSEIIRSVGAADQDFPKKHGSKKKAKILSKCEQCGKTFASAFQLRAHFYIQHLNERNYKCGFCQHRFGRTEGLRRHIQIVHNNHLHKCPYEGCDHPGYKCSNALTAHIRRVHTLDRPFVCPDCPKTFVKKNDMKMHSLVHSAERTFVCPCGARFRRQSYLRKHSKTCSLAVTAVSISEGGSPASNTVWPTMDEANPTTGLLSLPLTPVLRR